MSQLTCRERQVLDAERRSVEFELDPVDPDVVGGVRRRSRPTPETLAPSAGAVTLTVGGDEIGGIDDVREVTGIASVPAILLWSARTSQPFNVCDPTWTPENVYVPSRVMSIFTGSLVDLEMDVIDSCEVTRRRVGDVGCAADNRRRLGRGGDDELWPFGFDITGFAMSAWISAWVRAAR